MLKYATQVMMIPADNKNRRKIGSSKMNYNIFCLKPASIQNYGACLTSLPIKFWPSRHACP